MKEIWKDIESYEGLYQVSSLGRVKSLKYNKQRILKTPSDAYGYSVCNLSLNGKQKIFKVHKLVAIAFLNHTPNGHNMVVDHINNLKIDNRLENLQLTSQRENTSKDKKKGSSKYVGVYWKCSLFSYSFFYVGTLRVIILKASTHGFLQNDKNKQAPTATGVCPAYAP